MEPPLGEWIFSESLGADTKQWTLRCYPVFEARIHWQASFRRFHLTMNGTNFGKFRDLSVAMQRAEREIIDRTRQMLPVLAIVRRRLLSSPVAREPVEPVREVKAKAVKRPPVLMCLCGAIANDKTQLWADYDRWGRGRLYCYDCLPADLKEIVDRPINGQGCTGITPARCECLREALYVEDGQAYCEDCRPKKDGGDR
ncbi:MAG: hypothetical protein V4527_00655 [Pseudomonadota bacterium]